VLQRTKIGFKIVSESFSENREKLWLEITVLSLGIFSYQESNWQEKWCWKVLLNLMSCTASILIGACQL
jgi:hypothetical protein